MEVVFILIIFGIYVLATYLIAWWMLEPIHRAGGQVQLPTRYVLVDILALMALLQLPFAATGWAMDYGGERVAPYGFALVLLCGLVLVLWSAAVHVVSRAGITRALPRLVVITFLIPGTLAVIIGWPVLLVAGMEMADARPPALGIPVLVAAMFIVRWLAFWALDTSQLPIQPSVVPSSLRPPSP